MEAAALQLPELETHLERQMRIQERQLAFARALIAAAALVTVVLFRDRLDSFPWLAGLAVAVLVYTGAILVLVGRFPVREVGITATTLDMVVVTLAIYAEPQALDAYLFYVPVVLGVALRFGQGASLWASIVVSFMYASTVLVAGNAGQVVDLVPVRIGYLLGLGLASGLFARVVIGLSTEADLLFLGFEDQVLLLCPGVGHDAGGLLGRGLDRLVCPLAARGKAEAKAYGKAAQRPEGEGQEVHLHPPIRPWAVGRVVCSGDPPRGR